jgi:protein-disulfide isomerase
LRRILVVVAAAVGLAACQPAPDASFDQKVKAYLMAHPDDLRAALQNMQDKEAQAEVKAEAAADLKAKSLLPQMRAALERDPRDFVANPAGKVTVTEFYDYRCPHCINIAPRIVALIRSRPDVRFVFKEMPIFGETSEHAALVALAAKEQRKDYVGLYATLMAQHSLSDEDVDAIAKAKGVDLAALPAHDTHDRAQLADVAKLAQKLAIDGTPGFIVGDEIVHGEDYDSLTAAIARAGKAA